MEHPEHPFSWQALTRIILMGVIVILLWMARGAFVDILIALVIASSLYPIDGWVKRSFHIPHILSIFVVLLMILIPLVILGFAITPLVQQTPALLASMLAVLSPLAFVPRSVINFNINTYIQTNTNAILASSTSIFFIGLSVITIIILAFYFLYDSDRLIDLFLDLFPTNERLKIRGLLNEISRVTGRYIRGNILISCICAIVVAVGLLLLGIPYAIPLALFVGIIDLLPLVGSTIGAIPAVIIAFGVSPAKGILVIIVYLLYQQIESAFISPMIYNKALNISSALSFLSVIIGASLFGILGAFLALPVAASIPVLINYQKKYTKRHNIPPHAQ